MEKTEIKVFLNEKSDVLNSILSFINAEHINPISMGGVILKDERLFMTISYTNSSDEKTYSLKVVSVGNVEDGESLLISEIESSIPEGNVVCHEMIFDATGNMTIIYLIEE